MASDPSHFDDLREHMEQIQKNRITRKTDDELVHKDDTFEKVKAIVNKVVKAFLKGDRSLILQSTDFNGFYVSYGYSHALHIWIESSTEEAVLIMAQADTLTPVYSGKFKEEDMEDAVKNALLTWYTGIFSA